MPAALSGFGDVRHLVEAHAQQVAAVDGAHVEAPDVVFGAEGDHLGERGADFVADDGEGEAGKGHGANPTPRRLLWLNVFRNGMGRS